MERILMLENLRSIHNVGSIFRTASTVGVTSIFCVGTTPTPIDRFGRKRTDFSKVSLGAEDMVQWNYADSFSDIDLTIPIIAIEQTKDSKPYHTYTYPKKCAFVLGSETEGISDRAIEMCDDIVEIPVLNDGKESLNVSIACAVVLYHSLYGKTS